MDYEIKFSKVLQSPKLEEDRLTPKLRTKSPSKQSMFFQLSPIKSPNFEIDPVFSFSSPLLLSPLLKSPVTRKIPQRCLLSFPFESNMSDFYPHPIDWSLNDFVAICHINQVHLFSVKSIISPTSTIRFPDYHSMSLKFSQDGSKIIIGFTNGKIRIYDSNTLKMLEERNFFNKEDFCESASCIDTFNNVIMTTFSNGQVGILDERLPDSSNISILHAHKDQAITVSINRINENIFATSGNENTVKIWDFRNFSETNNCQNLLTYKEHEAAIRGIAWSPKETDVIVTGGGMDDQQIKKWNITTGNTIKSINIGSQVCNIFWNKEYSEILITSGVPYNNITIWNDSTLKEVGEINSHHDRILYAAMSPQNDKLVTLTPEDPIRIWNVFQQKTYKPSLR